MSDTSRRHRDIHSDVTAEVSDAVRPVADGSDIHASIDSAVLTPGSAPDTSSVSRRDALRRMLAVGAATVWATPVIEQLGAVAAYASTSPPPPPPPPPPPSLVCIGWAADLISTFGGTVSGFAGPAKETVPDTHHPKDCLSVLSLSVPTTSDVFATASLDCVENDFDDPENDGCLTRVTYESFAVDLSGPTLGLPVLVEGGVLDVSSLATCGGPPTGSTEIASLFVDVGGTTIGPMAVAPMPNTVLLDLGTVGVPGLTGTIVLNEQTTISDVITTIGIHITASLSVGGSLVQSADVKLAVTSAGISGCP